jgi:hypothetical protein
LPALCRTEAGIDVAYLRHWAVRRSTPRLFEKVTPLEQVTPPFALITL